MINSMRLASLILLFTSLMKHIHMWCQKKRYRGHPHEFKTLKFKRSLHFIIDCLPQHNRGYLRLSDTTVFQLGGPNTECVSILLEILTFKPRVKIKMLIIKLHLVWGIPKVKDIFFFYRVKLIIIII